MLAFKLQSRPELSASAQACKQLSLKKKQLTLGEACAKSPAFRGLVGRALGLPKPPKSKAPNSLQRLEMRIAESCRRRQLMYSSPHVANVCTKHPGTRSAQNLGVTEHATIRKALKKASAKNDKEYLAMQAMTDMIDAQNKRRGEIALLLAEEQVAQEMEQEFRIRAEEKRNAMRSAGEAALTFAVKQKPQCSIER